MSALLFLALAGFAGGAMNAVAGGGQFIIFPALLFAGVPPVAANITGGIATIPGQFSTVWAYRHDIRAATVFDIRLLMLVSTAGGLLGALTLLLTPGKVFTGVLPWLMLLATCAFTAGNIAPPHILERFRLGARSIHVFQFGIAIYGGYFGAGIGFMMLAALTLYGMRDIHAMNGLKMVLALCMTLVASVAFITAGRVWWTEAVIMGLASLAGGYTGASIAKLIDPRFIKLLVVALGVALTAYFFTHGAGR
jgi:uncharacterized protein